MAIAGALMSVINAASLWYAVRETGIDRTWAYFDTLPVSGSLASAPCWQPLSGRSPEFRRA
jgi:hypothetical protein